MLDVGERAVLSEISGPPIQAKAILVVEDDRCLETFLLRTLKAVHPHLRIDWATTAEDALSRIVAKEIGTPRPYDLILADVVLDSRYTGLDLWEICQRRGLKSPFLVMSGMPSDAYIKAFGSRKSCPPFLQKPFSIRECRQTIEGILNRKDFFL